jgi:nucleoside-diphosphate-sugar epimerase
MLSAMARDAGIEFAAVRLPHTYGAESLLFELIRGGLVIFPGSLEVVCAQLHVRDAARGLIEIARQGWTGTTPIADEGEVSWREFFDVVRLYYPRFRLLRFPRWVAIAGTAALQPLLWLRKAPTLTTPGTITGFNLNLPVDSSPLWRDLGIRPDYPTVAEGIPAALDDYIRFRWRHPVHDTAS